jgi:hypothetical protein
VGCRAAADDDDFLNKSLPIYYTLKAVVEWLIFLLRMREVQLSNLGPDTDYTH